MLGLVIQIIGSIAVSSGIICIDTVSQDAVRKDCIVLQRCCCNKLPSAIVLFVLCAFLLFVCRALLLGAYQVRLAVSSWFPCTSSVHP